MDSTAYVLKDALRHCIQLHNYDVFDRLLDSLKTSPEHCYAVLLAGMIKGDLSKEQASRLSEKYGLGVDWQ